MNINLCKYGLFIGHLKKMSASTRYFLGKTSPDPRDPALKKALDTHCPVRVFYFLLNGILSIGYKITGSTMVLYFQEEKKSIEDLDGITLEILKADISSLLMLVKKISNHSYYSNTKMESYQQNLHIVSIKNDTSIPWELSILIRFVDKSYKGCVRPYISYNKKTLNIISPFCHRKIRNGILSITGEKSSHKILCDILQILERNPELKVEGVAEGCVNRIVPTKILEQVILNLWWWITEDIERKICQFPPVLVGIITDYFGNERCVNHPNVPNHLLVRAEPHIGLLENKQNGTYFCIDCILATARIYFNTSVRSDHHFQMNVRPSITNVLRLLNIIPMVDHL